MMKYGLRRLQNETVLDLDTLLGARQIKTGAPADCKVSFTATTQMQSSMGKVMAILDGLAVVDTVWNDARSTVDCTPVVDLKIGDMVWVSEHLSLSGEMNILASIAKPSFGDINFINLSWDDNKVRVDVLTGEYQING